MKAILVLILITVVSFAGIFGVKYAAEHFIEQTKQREKLSELIDSTTITVASTFLAALVAAIVKILAPSGTPDIKRESDVKPPPEAAPSPLPKPVAPLRDPRAEIRRLEAEKERLAAGWAKSAKQYTRLTRDYEKLHTDYERVKSFARAKFAVLVSLVAAMIYAWLWPLTAWVETAVYEVVGFNPDAKLPLSVQNFFLAYLQTTLLSIGAAIVGFFAYRYFYMKTKSRKQQHAFVIGFVGIAACGLVSLLLMNPRMWGTYFAGGGLTEATYMTIPRFVYVAIQRLLLLPTAGFVGCAVYRLTSMGRAGR